MKAGVNEKVEMAISGHKTLSVFERYHIIDTGAWWTQCGGSSAKTTENAAL
jgi:hypothetical protein